MSSEDSLYYFSTLTINTQRTMNIQGQEIMRKRFDAVIAERDELKNLLIYVIAERDELKISMRLWMVVAIVNAVILFINAVVFFITIFAF